MPTVAQKTDKLGAKIVVIGGGTGSFTVLSGLKNYAQNITALVNMVDDGGSTGQLRDEFGVLPPGDVRQCLVALSDSERVRDLFNYRFNEGSLKGHAFGNLFLTALQKMTGSFAEAVELASEVLNITGRVEPITLTDVKYCMKIGHGETIRGQFDISNVDLKGELPTIWLEPEAILNPAAERAILEADMLVIAPGNLYGSLAPVLAVKGLREVLQSSPAKKVYICNLVTKPGQTDTFNVIDFANEIERLAGASFLDYIIYNTAEPSADLLEKYAHEGEYAVRYDSKLFDGVHYKVRGADVLSPTIWHGDISGDTIAYARTLIRHDGDKLARQLMRIYFS